MPLVEQAQNAGPRPPTHSIGLIECRRSSISAKTRLRPHGALCGHSVRPRRFNQSAHFLSGPIGKSNAALAKGYLPAFQGGAGSSGCINRRATAPAAGPRQRDAAVKGFMGLRAGTTRPMVWLASGSADRIVRNLSVRPSVAASCAAPRSPSVRVRTWVQEISASIPASARVDAGVAHDSSMIRPFWCRASAGKVAPSPPSSMPPVAVAERRVAEVEANSFSDTAARCGDARPSGSWSDSSGRHRSRDFPGGSGFPCELYDNELHVGMVSAIGGDERRDHGQRHRNGGNPQPAPQPCPRA